jgi:hypothetical protein
MNKKWIMTESFNGELVKYVTTAKDMGEIEKNFREYYEGNEYEYNEKRDIMVLYDDWTTIESAWEIPDEHYDILKIYLPEF